jgi:hypothetical protein
MNLLLLVVVLLIIGSESALVQHATIVVGFKNRADETILQILLIFVSVVFVDNLEHVGDLRTDVVKTGTNELENSVLSLERLSNVENYILKELDVLRETQHPDNLAVNLDGFKDEVLHSVDSSVGVGVTGTGGVSPELESEVFDEWSQEASDSPARELMTVVLDFFLDDEEGSLSSVNLKIKHHLHESFLVLLLVLRLEPLQVQEWKLEDLWVNSLAETQV